LIVGFVGRAKELVVSVGIVAICAPLALSLGD
jgi:hypothetical protein